MSTRALIVDDHPIIRNALVTSLVSLSVFDEVETTGSFQGLLEKLERDASYQLLILDLSLTDISGSDGMLYIRENYADIPVVIFSGNDSIDTIFQCFENGVHGFVSKNSSMQVFVQAIQMVLAGGIFIPPSAIELMGFEPTQTGEGAPVPAAKPLQFTSKQHQVFEQLMLGVPNKVIATRLGMAVGTVKAHLHSVYQILGVHNRAQAILKSQQIQIVD